MVSQSSQPSDPNAQQRRHRLSALYLGATFIFAVLILGGSFVFRMVSERGTPRQRTNLVAIRDTPIDLGETATKLLALIHQSEIATGATNWSTLRQQENQSVSQQLLPTAVTARLTSSKTLLRELWQRASSATPNDIVTEADLRPLCPKPLISLITPMQAGGESAQKAALSLGVKLNAKGTPPAEDLRLLLSLAVDAISGAGEFTTGIVDIKPLDDSAAAFLGLASRGLSVLVLGEARASAESAQRAQINEDDVAKAHNAVAVRLQLDRTTAALSAETAPHPYGARIPQKSDTAARLNRLTRTYIDNKIRALQNADGPSIDEADINTPAEVLANAKSGAEKWTALTRKHVAQPFVTLALATKAVARIPENSPDKDATADLDRLRPFALQWRAMKAWVSAPEETVIDPLAAELLAEHVYKLALH